MSNVIIDTANLIDIANAIRLKTGSPSSTKYIPRVEMAQAIRSILTPTDGSIQSKSAYIYTPGTTNQIITSGQYLSGDQTISGDSNLIAENIKWNTSIFGVSGSYRGGNLRLLNINENGEYIPDSNYIDGFSDLKVSVHPGLIHPYRKDYACYHYVQNGSYILTGTSVSTFDYYQCSANKSYLILLGSFVGTRFRIMFSTVDPAVQSENTVGTSIINLNNPSRYEARLYTSLQNGYITIQKDNTGVTGIPTFLFELSLLVDQNDEANEITHSVGSN